MEIKAQHILVKDKSLAQQILTKIRTGANFESLARQYSTCPSKSSGGDLGWFKEGQMVAPFEAACKRIGVGSVSDIVQTQFGYHIIRVTGKK